MDGMTFTNDNSYNFSKKIKNMPKHTFKSPMEAREWGFTMNQDHKPSIAGSIVGNIDVEQTFLKFKQLAPWKEERKSSVD